MGESAGDAARIREETGDHGDTRTTHPRLVCRACASFVYLTQPRAFRDGVTRAECDCKFGDPTRDEIPDAWVSIDESGGDE